jgi:hypothetical protein
MAFQQIIRAPANALGICQCGGGASDLGSCPIEFRFIPAAIDDEEHITFVNNLARREMDFSNMPGNAGAYFHGFDRIDSGGSGFPINDLAWFTR